LLCNLGHEGCRTGSRLVVCNLENDSVSIVDPQAGTVVSEVDLRPGKINPAERGVPGGEYPYGVVIKGNDLAYVSSLRDREIVVVSVETLGEQPAVATSQDGQFLFVTNWKSPAGPNPEHFTNPINSNAANQYVLQLEKAGLFTIPLVTDPGTLDQLTRTVAANNGYSVQPDANDQAVMSELRDRIKHVIYIVKENRTYDQLFGDLPEGNGDPFITQFGYDVTPNFHRLVTGFVLLDNFYTPGDVSGNGWPWSTAGRETDYGVKSIAENYASRGFSYDTEGTNRDVNVGHPTLQQRLAVAPYMTPDPDILPGAIDVAAPDGPEGQKGKGYLWDAAVRKGLSIRDYGLFCDLVRYGTTAGKTDISAYQIPIERYPA
jgi:hypothetical protein